jgi:D-alanine-D-alanine ligase
LEPETEEHMPHPRVLVVYNEPVLPRDHPDFASEHDILETLADTCRILQAAGFTVGRLGFNHDPAVLLKELRDSPPDAVFNLFEGLATDPGTEVTAAGLLEWVGVPFTGSPSTAIALARDKVRTKHLLRGAGLPTPPFLVVEDPPWPAWPHPWPAIVKPACQDGSVGIDQNSVVTDQEQLANRVEYILERYGPPVLIEQFIFGREFHVSYIEEPGETPLAPVLTLVPLAEVRFRDERAEGLWPVYTYEAKWAEQSEEFRTSPLETPVYVPAAETERIDQVCRAAYRLVGLRDYGRVDIRLAPNGEPYVLEVNPNPYLNSAPLVRGLEIIGRSFKQFVADLVWAALARAGKGGRPLPSHDSAGVGSAPKVS